MLLLVEDDDVDARRVVRLLRKRLQSLEIVRVTTVADALAAAKECRPAVILADLTLPDAQKLDAVRALIDVAPNTPLIVQSGRNDSKTPVEALSLGAEDYLVKDELTPDGLFRSLRYAITRHQLRVDLETALVDLKATNADLEEMLAVFAHDLRGPIRKARLLSGRIVSGSPTPDAGISQMQGMMDAALCQVDELVRTMLDYESLRRIEVAREPVDVAVVVADSVEMLQAELDAAGGTCRCLVSHDLVAAATPELLTQVFVHLLSNSIKFRRQDLPPAITVSGEAVGGRLMLAVSDNGRGIPEGQGHRATQVMQRLHPDEASGHGFGLAICRRIVEGLGGELRVQAGSEGGTTVLVDLPEGRSRSASSGRLVRRRHRAATNRDAT